MSESLKSTPDTFDPDAFDRLACGKLGHFWFEERRRLIAWAVQRYFPVPASSPAAAFREIASNYPVFELVPS